jgi:surface protein
MRFSLFACVSSLLAPDVITARLSSVKHVDHNNEQHKQHQQLLLDSSSFSKLKLNEGFAIRREFRNIDDINDNNKKKDAPTSDTTDYNSDSYPPSLADDSYDPTVAEEGGAEGAYQKENNYYVNHYDVGISFMNEKLNDEEAVDHYNDHHYHQQQQLDERHLQQLNCNEICSGPRPVVFVGADTVRDSDRRRARSDKVRDSDRRSRDRDSDRRSRDREPAPLLNFSDLINACLNNDRNSNCPQEFSLSEINCWNTERVTDMKSAFRSQRVFNEPLGCWNTSRVTKMDNLFYRATSFNQPINNWDTSSVTSMRLMFGRADYFNQPVDDWNSSRVTTMDNMFFSATSFNQPINNWDTSSVTSMRFMFGRANSFNQPFDDWNTSRVTTMIICFLVQLLSTNLLMAGTRHR